MKKVFISIVLLATMLCLCGCSGVNKSNKETTENNSRRIIISESVHNIYGSCYGEVYEDTATGKVYFASRFGGIIELDEPTTE